MRLRFLPQIIAASGFASFSFWACSDWSSLEGEDCNGELVKRGADCVALSGTGNVGGEAGDGDTGGGGDDGVEPQQPSCGNGMLDLNEVCDDGNTDNDDSCLGGCSWSTCGDGFLRQGVESCDDGNIDSGDGCVSSCLTCGQAGSYFRVGTGHCYVVHDEELTYDEARAVCGLEGGYLLTSTAGVEAGIVKRRLAGATRELWLGMKLEGGEPVWITGEASMDLPWVAGEPTNLDCGVQFGTGTSDENFRAIACSESRAFVCEHEAAKTDPTTHHAYRRWFVETTREEAIDFCASEGGLLVALESEAEREFVRSRFVTDFWVSAKRASDADYEWEPDGGVVPVGEMGAGADTQAGNDCLFHTGGELLPGPCDAHRALVCEFP